MRGDRKKRNTHANIWQIVAKNVHSSAEFNINVTRGKGGRDSAKCQLVSQLLLAWSNCATVHKSHVGKMESMMYCTVDRIIC